MTQTAINNTLQIFTFGQFRVYRGEKLLSECSGRSQKLWDLFKYLIIHREQGILPESAFDTLWPEKQCADPKRAMQTAIYRLRKILEGKYYVGGRATSIVFTHGRYQLQDSGLWIDAVTFEQLCQEATLIRDSEPARAILLLMEALSLYRGDYFSENAYSEWILPFRNYYRRLFLQSSLTLLKLLKQENRFEEIINVCEKVFLIELLEEEFHTHFLDALIRERKINQARSHYEYITSLLYRELGVKPSGIMTRLYNRTKMSGSLVDMNLDCIQNGLMKRRCVRKAFYCEPDIFPLFYELERRRSKRLGISVYIGLITIRLNYHEDGKLKVLMDDLNQILLEGLRKSDVYTQWCNSQYLLLLPGATAKNAERVFQRVRKTFYVSGRAKGCILDCQYQSILLEEERQNTEKLTVSEGIVSKAGIKGSICVSTYGPDLPVGRQKPPTPPTS